MTLRKYSLALTIMTFITVFVTVIGLSFAYFVTTISGSTSNIALTAGKVGTVTFNGGSNFTTGTYIEPGWNESKTFVISVGPTSASQRVYIKMIYTNTLTDLVCNVSSSSSNSGAVGNVPLVATGTATTVTLVDKTFTANSGTQSITYTMTLSFPDTNVNQNAQQGKSFSSTLFATFGTNRTYYYNNANSGGTATVPTAIAP